MAPAKGEERFWPHFQPQSGVEHMETARLKSGKKQVDWMEKDEKRIEIV